MDEGGGTLDEPLADLVGHSWLLSSVDRVCDPVGGRVEQRGRRSAAVGSSRVNAAGTARETDRAGPNRV